MTDEINTITLSGRLSAWLETSEVSFSSEARFLMEVESSERDGTGHTFQIVTAPETTEDAVALKQGDRLILVGSLRTLPNPHHGPSFEILARILIRTPAPEVEDALQCEGEECDTIYV